MIPLDAAILEVNSMCDKIFDEIENYLMRNPIEKMTEEEVDSFLETINKYDDSLTKPINKFMNQLGDPDVYENRSKKINDTLTNIVETQYYLEDFRQMINLRRYGTIYPI